MTAKTTVPCLPHPPVHGHLVNVSQQIMRSCGAWLKTLHQLKSCGSFQGGWSLWWRKRSQERGGVEEAALEVTLQRRQLWRKQLQDWLRNHTKITHHRALTLKLKGLLTPPRTTTLLLVPLCTHSQSDVILHIPHPIFPLTCLC